jgi:hypothetical protein
MSPPLDATTFTESTADEPIPTLVRASESCSAEAVDRDEAMASTATMTLAVGARVVGLTVGEAVGALVGAPLGLLVGDTVGFILGADVGRLGGSVLSVIVACTSDPVVKP